MSFLFLKHLRQGANLQVQWPNECPIFSSTLPNSSAAAAHSSPDPLTGNTIRENQLIFPLSPNAAGVWIGGEGREKRRGIKK